jgi:hypothetical protein
MQKPSTCLGGPFKLLDEESNGKMIKIGDKTEVSDRQRAPSEPPINKYTRRQRTLYEKDQETHGMKVGVLPVLQLHVLCQIEKIQSNIIAAIFVPEVFHIETKMLGLQI